MAVGFRCRNADQIIQIDSYYVNSHLVTQGYCDTLAIGTVAPQYEAAIALAPDYSSAAEAPVVFVKPTQTGKWIGSVQVASPYEAFGSFPARPNGELRIRAECPFYWALFSQIGNPVSRNLRHGLRVRHPVTGQVVYTSNNIAPRITTMMPLIGGAGRWPTTVSFPTHSAIPWIFAANLVDCSAGQETDPYAMMAKINPGLSTMTVDYLNTNTMQHEAGDPFEASPALVGVGALA